MKQKFSSYDFAAFQLMAGNPPPARGFSSHESSLRIADRLAWIANCDVFMEEYFNPRFPHARWMDFYNDFLVWLEFHKELQQEKDDGKQENTKPVHTGRGSTCRVVR